MIVVVGEDGLVIVEAPGFVERALHVPVPAPAMVTVLLPPEEHIKMLAPPLLIPTYISTVSGQPPVLVHIKLYIPAVVKPDMADVGLDGFVIVVADGLPGTVVQVPEPVAANDVEAPTDIYCGAPPFDCGSTVTCIVSYVYE